MSTVEYEGYRFSAPFLCMCCGIETSIEQWAYGRTCGLCDTGICWMEAHYSHEIPAWEIGRSTREDAIRRYAEAVGGEAIETGIGRPRRPKGTARAVGIAKSGKQ